MIDNMLKYNSELMTFIFGLNFKDRTAFDDTPYVNYSKVDSSTFREYLNDIENEDEIHMFCNISRLTYHISTDTISFGMIDFFNTMSLGVPHEYAKIIAKDYKFPITISNSKIFIGGNELTEELQFMLSTSEDFHQLYKSVVDNANRLESLVRDEIQEFYKDRISN